LKEQMLASYRHFLERAAASQWDEAAIDLAPDAATWPGLPAETRRRLAGMIESFGLGEAALSRELESFEQSVAGTAAAACVAAQRRDEARHARFFARLRGEVLGAGASAFGSSEADGIDAVFAELFERRLPDAAARLAAGEIGLPAAVALCHMLLEGCVFGAGQSALLALLEHEPGLPGMRRGVELVVRDERWHLGFGARLLQDAELDEDLIAALAADGDRVLEAWKDLVEEDTLERARLLHRRRLRAAGLLAQSA
jgi:ribonucleoside-diphosphate reductase beta chain